MSTYAVSDFSFNIGTTNISQQYVPLVKQDVPWGINSTYIYKAPTLANQFNVNNKHLVIENQCLSGNIVFKTQETGRIIINDLSVGTINGLPYSGNGSGVGIGLTANSVNSSHIIDGSILGTDISDNTITNEKLQDDCVTNTKIQDGAVTESKLSTALLERLDALEIRKGIITIKNVTLGSQEFNYKLFYNNSSGITQFASYNSLYPTISASHYFILPTSTTYIRIEISININSIDSINIVYGATIYEMDALAVDFNITDVNVLIELQVS